MEKSVNIFSWTQLDTFHKTEMTMCSMWMFHLYKIPRYHICLMKWLKNAYGKIKTVVQIDINAIHTIVKVSISFLLLHVKSKEAALHHPCSIQWTWYTERRRDDIQALVNNILIQATSWENKTQLKDEFTDQLLQTWFWCFQIIAQHVNGLTFSLLFRTTLKQF